MTASIERLTQQLDDSTGREWAAMALASLKIDGAVEPVRRAHRACLERATPPDWSEPEGIRWALTGLDARTPVVPPLTSHLRATAADNAPGWPSAHFTRDHQRPGRPRPGDPLLPVLASGCRPHVRRLGHWPGLGTRLDRALGAPGRRVPHLVLLEAPEAPVGDNIFVAPTWIDRTDLNPER